MAPALSYPGVGAQGDSHEPQSDDAHLQHILQTTEKEELVLRFVQL